MAVSLRTCDPATPIDWHRVAGSPTILVRLGWGHMEPILTGADEQAWSTEDVAYVRDLGLVAQDAAGTPRIANPVYAEVVPRHLNYAVQAGLPQQVAWYVGADEGLDVEGLLAAFQEVFREHSEHSVQRFRTISRGHEAGPQLLLQAHLQRVVNGGGRIKREYALGRGRTDLLIVWPQGGRVRRLVAERKVLRKELERTIAEGVEQTRGYMDRCGAEAGSWTWDASANCTDRWTCGTGAKKVADFVDSGLTWFGPSD